MTNEEMIDGIIITMKKEAEDLGFCFDAATENSVRFACGWIADWKDREYEKTNNLKSEKQNEATDENIY